MFRKPIKEISAEFLAEEKYLDSIQQVVRESCVAAEMSRKDQSAVMLAIEEAATNIIRHAYLYEKGTIRLRVVIYRKLIAFSLIDSGRSFHPEKDGALDLDRLVDSGRKGGLGFYMIQKIMDSVEYISSAGFNELRMIKRRKSVADRISAPGHSLFSLRVKFSLFTFLIVALIISGTYIYVYQETKTEVYRHLDDTAAALGNTIASQTAGYIINDRSDVEFDELVVAYTRSNQMLKPLILTDLNGVILAHSEETEMMRSQYQLPDYFKPTEIGEIQRINREGEKLNHVVVPIQSGERLYGYVHLTYSSELVDQKLVEARFRILIFTGLLVLIGVIGIYLLSNYFVKPISIITRRVRRFASGDLETELPLEGAEEFFEISKAFNEMITRLSRDRTNLIEREKLAKEIEVASQIQKTLLPGKLPDIPGLQLDAFYRAAQMVGGDLYDAFQVDENHYCLVVADVSGKGVPASLVMSMLRTVIQIYAHQADSAREILVKVNDYMVESSPPGMFVTVLLALFDASQCSLNLVSAGHNPLLVYRADTKDVKSINPPGMPLGVRDTLSDSFADRLEEVQIKLNAGDLFIMYTDGITEACDREGALFGQAKLTQFLIDELIDIPDRPIADLTKELVSQIDDFSGFTRQADDITFVLARAGSRGDQSGKPSNLA